MILPDDFILNITSFEGECMQINGQAISMMDVVNLRNYLTYEIIRVQTERAAHVERLGWGRDED